jgi:hypothetical protein
MKKTEPTVDKNPAKIPKNETCTLIRLLRTEDLMLWSGSRLVSTLTWFQGDYTVAAAKLQTRLVALIGANPWLTGRIIRQRRVNYLAYSAALDHHKNNNNDTGTTAALTEAAVQDLFTVVSPEESPLSRETPIIQASAIARHSGYTCRPKWNQPVYLVTVVPCRTNPTSKFALVVSMSHIAGDGHTFYSLYNCLVGTNDDAKGNKEKTDSSTTDDCSLPQLQVERIATSLQQIGQVILDHQAKSNKQVQQQPTKVSRTKPPREPLLAQSPALLIPSALSLIAGKVRERLWPCGSSNKDAAPFPTTQRYCLVDVQAVQRLKQEAVNENTMAATTTTTTTSIISTNDIITSWILSRSRCRHGFMAVNVRGRLAGHDMNHAGNYFSLVYYRVPDDCATPSLIRSSIEPLCRTVTSTIPPNRHWLGGGSVIVTNWATFATSRVTLGIDDSDVQEELHCPLFTHQLDQHPANVVIGIVFRARGSQLGMFLCGTPSKLRGLADCPFATQSDFI